mgnify:CR=1 FL=1
MAEFNALAYYRDHETFNFYSIGGANLSQLGNLLKELKILDFLNSRRIRIVSDYDGIIAV